MSPTVILGSRSPRRHELLELLVPAERIVVKPPSLSDEAGFHGLTREDAIAERLLEIVEAKRQDVTQQLSDDEIENSVAIVADTIIVVAQPDGSPLVLGQPPEPDWQPAVREWFTRHYSGKTHAAWTGLCVWDRAGILIDEIVRTRVTFRKILPSEIDWYLTTAEPRGKAGGYALQGLANVFVEKIEGSLTNVVGMPLEVLRRVLGTKEPRTK